MVARIYDPRRAVIYQRLGSRGVGRSRRGGVVDAGDDVLDAEVLVGDAGDEDVRVVAARDRGDGAGLLDARLDESVAVEPDALDGRPGEVGTEPGERLGRRSMIATECPSAVS